MRKSEITVGPSGDVGYRNRSSGPLKAGEIVLRLEVTQSPGTVLDEQRLALLRQQTEAFLDTLRDGAQPDAELAVIRLRREVTPDTWKTLLAVGTDRAYWLIQAWAAEARLASGERRSPMAEPFDAEGLLALLQRWADALQFQGILGLKRHHQADWRHVAANARAQAEVFRRRAKHLAPGLRGGGPHHLWPRLRSRMARGDRLLLLGLKTASLFDVALDGLLDRHAELILADGVDSGLRRFAPEISGGGYAAAILLPDLPSVLAAETESACLAHGLPCVRLASRGAEDLEACLTALDSALQEKSCRTS